MNDFQKVYNLISQLGQTADDSINNGTPVTLEIMGKFLTEDVIWTFNEQTFEGLEKVVGLWNDFNGKLQFGRHHYDNHVIQTDQEQPAASWILWGIFTDKQGVDTWASGAYKTSIKLNDSVWKISHVWESWDFQNPISDGWKLRDIH